MKNIKKLAIYLTLLALADRSELYAVGGHGVPGISGSSNIDHGGSNHEMQKAAIGGAAYHSSQQSAMESGAGAGAAAGMMSGGQSSGDSSGSGGSSGGSSTPTTPTTTPLPTAETPNQQYSPGVNTGVPTTVNSNNAPDNTTTPDSTATPAIPAAPADEKKDEKDTTAQLAEALSETHDTDTVIDEKELLDKINAVNVHDQKIDFLLTQDSMKLLFNNFVYFKNFLVRNFSKEKMLSLAATFIDQIYPIDKVEIINNTSVMPLSTTSESQHDDHDMSEHHYQETDHNDVDQSQHMNHESNDQHDEQQLDQHDDQTNQDQEETEQE